MRAASGDSKLSMLLSRLAAALQKGTDAAIAEVEREQGRQREKEKEKEHLDAARTFKPKLLDVLSGSPAAVQLLGGLDVDVWRNIEGQFDAAMRKYRTEVLEAAKAEEVGPHMLAFFNGSNGFHFALPWLTCKKIRHSSTDSKG